MASETSVDNGYVVVWQQHSNSTGHRLAGKTIDVDGNPLGDFFFIGQQTFRPFEPAVSSLADGSYVVIWRGDTRYYDDLEGHALLGQIYNPDGSPKGEEIVVSTDHHSTNTSLSVTATANGGFVTTWTSYGVENDSQEDSFGISGQLFSRDGEKIGDSFLVNTNTNRSQQYSDVTTLSNGRFVVTWESDDPEIAGSYTTWDNNIGIYRGISGQIFSASGEPIGDEFRVNTFTQGTQSTPVVSPLESGGFVVAWSGFNSLESDGPVTNQGITAQVFDGNGKRIGDEISVNTYERWFQENPSAVGLSNGGFVITWTSSSDVSGQLFDAHYNPIGSEFTVNTSVEHSQGDSATVAVEDGGFIVTWTDLGGMSTAGSIAGQRFDATGNKIGEQFSIASPYGRVGASDIARLLPVSSTLLESNDVNIAIYEDENFVKFEVGDSKPENNSLTYIISDGLPENQGNVVNNNDGTFTFLPGDDFKSLTEDQAQDVTFTYIVTDSAGNTSSPATVTITVNGVDHLPEADDYSSTGREDDTSITGTLTATDEDGGDLSYALVDAPSKGSVTVTQDGNFSFEPGDDFDDLGAGESRDITFTYVATDPEGNTSNPGTVTVTIAGINQQPIVTAVAISGTEDDAGISSSVIGTDPEGGELTYSLLEAPAEGSVEFGTDGNFTFVPGDDFKDLADGESRDVSFTYIATDEHGATSDPELVTVTVSGINHAPVVSNVTTTGSREDNEITGGLLGTDEDGDDLTFNLVDAPTEGSVVFDGNGLFSFSPGSDFDDLAEGESREISFTYTATDEIGLTSDPASVTITVSDKPEGFVAVWSSYREDAEGWGVFGQYYEADGTAAGDIFQVNTTEVKSQDEPAITSLTHIFHEGIYENG
ncbi:Ig-like domain-containing protein [Pontibacterium sp.]|uniref:Ig-like domain-containing protein n=1 Tax=Pontibacterium sp. TaxID=2036026 RepID=UPI0035154B18